MGKYVSAMLAAGARLTFAMQPTPLWLAMVIVTSSVATVYQLYWDFVKDWGLLNPKSKNPWLRDELVLKNNSIYYVSIVSYQYCLFSIFRPQFLLSSIKLQRQFLRRMVFLGSEFCLETRLGWDCDAFEHWKGWVSLARLPLGLSRDHSTWSLEFLQVINLSLFSRLTDNTTRMVSPSNMLLGLCLRLMQFLNSEAPQMQWNE